VALALAGCGGGDGGGGSPRRATLVLDFVPNAVHVGIYRALRAGYYRDEGLRLRVASPSSTADSVKLVLAGKADFGLADPIDVARAVATGHRLRAIEAIVERPLGGLIARADSPVRTPADLAGRTVGVTGVPSDDAVLDEVVRAAGGDPKRVRRVSIGFGGVQALAAKRVAAFTGFWPADAPSAQAAGAPTRVFPLDANGGPRYPGLVAFAAQRTIDRDPELVRGFVAATVHGYRDALSDEAAARRDLLAANPALKGKVVDAQLRQYLPVFRAGAARLGELPAAGLRALSRFLTAFKLIPAPIPPARLGTNAFVP
jgi:putative hydroxymethylpyrimidine transport system substrate-binding protein